MRAQSGHRAKVSMHPMLQTGVIPDSCTPGRASNTEDFAGAYEARISVYAP